jgi:hypothetical protein
MVKKIGFGLVELDESGVIDLFPLAAEIQSVFI